MVVDNLNSLFAPYDRRRPRVRVQGPVRLGIESEPEPDIAIIRLPPSGTSAQHPTPEDVLLLIEVADTSLEYDRRTKLPLYARHGIPEEWIVDLTSDVVSVHRDPTSAG